MRIAICGNSAQDRNSLSQLLKRRLHELCADADIAMFDDGAALLNQYGQNGYKFVFIDVDPDARNSLELAEKIRARTSDCPIVFYSDTAKHALKCYSVHPSGYFLKPLNYGQLCDTLTRYRESITDALRKIRIISSRIPLDIFLADIFYIEVQGRMCVLHTNAGCFNTNQSLTNLTNQLDSERFIRCHRNYLVNQLHISEVDGSNLLMTDGYCVPINPVYSDVVAKSLNYVQEHSHNSQAEEL